MKRGVLLLLVAAGAAWAAAAWASEDPVRLTRYPTAVRPGEMFQLEWSNPSEDVEELEILLSLDGGRHYSLRITPELDARTRHFMWRIPDSATEHARLRIRYGREHEEALGRPTPEFAIRMRGDSDSRTGEPASEAPMVHEPGWWSSTDAEPPGNSNGISADGAEISNGAAAAPASESRRPDFGRPTPAPSFATLPERALAPPAPNPASTIPSRFIPLRE